MVKKIQVFVLAALLALPAFHAYSGSNYAESSLAFPGMPSTIKVEASTLVLNGQGIRHKMWIDLFKGALYLKRKCNVAPTIINSNEEMSIRIEVISDVITSKRLKDAIYSEFKRVAGKDFPLYEQRINALVKAFHEDIKIGDAFDLTYTPSDGVNIYKNNQLKSHIAGLDFKKVLFSIWLGEDPQDEGLKKGMLGS